MVGENKLPPILWYVGLRLVGFITQMKGLYAKCTNYSMKIVSWMIMTWKQAGT